MIPVKKQPEPENFDKLVRTPGLEFLKNVPNPTPMQWKIHAYWKKILKEMRKAYRGICAYSAHWIPADTGNPSIDHFKPKSLNPGLAYEWDNYRYASSKYNSLKGTKKILDPFTLKPDLFVLDFPSLKVQPNKELLPRQKEAVKNTIEILKFNKDETCKEARQTWLTDYCSGNITFKHLEDRAPFIAYELKRQGLVKKIFQKIKYPGSNPGAPRRGEPI